MNAKTAVAFCYTFLWGAAIGGVVVWVMLFLIYRRSARETLDERSAAALYLNIRAAQYLETGQIEAAKWTINGMLDDRIMDFYYDRQQRNLTGHAEQAFLSAADYRREHPFVRISSSKPLDDIVRNIVRNVGTNSTATRAP